MSDRAIDHTIHGAYWLGQHQPALAVSELREALRLDPHATPIRHALAVIRWIQGEWEEAIEQLREASRRDPDSLESLLLLGDALEALGEPDEALQIFRQAIRLVPESAAAHYACGGVLMKTDQVLAAIAAYHEAERWVPLLRDRNGEKICTGRVIDRFLDLAVVRMRQTIRGRRRKAAEYGRRRRSGPATDDSTDARVGGMQELLFLKADDDVVFRQLAHSLEETGRPEEAVAAYREAIRLNLLERADASPDYLTSKLYYDLGLCLKKQGQRREALAAFEESVRLNPRRRAARDALADARSVAGGIASIGSSAR